MAARRARGESAAPVSESLVELTIDSIAAGGDGVARTGGLVVFVPRSAPGDEGTARVVAKGRFARGALAELRRPSPLRVEPPCAHYTADRCGGCQLQHLGYEAQLEAKATIIRDALQRIGKITVARPHVRPSPAPWRYRRKLTLALRRRHSRWIAGLHPYDDPGAVFALRDCPITTEAVVAAWTEIMRAAELLPAADALRGSVRLLTPGTVFVLEGADTWPTARAFFDAVPAIAALWWTPTDRRRRLVYTRGGAAPASASFAQVNAPVAEMLRSDVVERASRYAPRTLVDAYAGDGDTAAALAGRGVIVVAIELDPDAASACAKRLPSGSRCINARVEDALPDALPADVVILNPPRSGIDARVASQLTSAEPRPRALIYASCNPATLARDLARLPGYQVVDLQGFDMFPQTAHVEAVCELIPGEP